MNKRRDDFVEFAYHTFRTIKDGMFPLLVMAISFIGERNKLTPYIEKIFYFIIVLLVIYSFLKWYKKQFEFSDHYIRISQGVFTKNLNEIPYGRVRSVNTSDTFFKRLFSLSDLSIELIGGKKIIFVMKNDDINYLKQELFNEINSKEESNKIKGFTLLEYFLISITNRMVFLGALSIIATLLPFTVNFLANKGVVEKPNNEGVLEEIQTTGFDFFEFFIGTTVMLLICIIAAYVLSFFYIYLTYGGFLLNPSAKKIDIQYGRINIKKYHIPKKQIRSLRIIEPFLFRLTGYVQLKIDTVGLSNKEAASIIIHPALKKESIDEFIKENIPEFKLDNIDIRPKRNTCFIFIMQPTFYLVSIILAASLAESRMLYGLFLLPLPIMLGYTKWKHSGISFNQKYITIRYVNKFKRITVTSLKKYAETTTVNQSIFMRRK